VVEENFWDVRSASNGSRSPSLMSDQLEQPEEMVKEKKNYWYSVGSEKHVFENVQSVSSSQQPYVNISKLRSH